MTELEQAVSRLEVALIGYIGLIGGEDISEEIDELSTIEERINYVAEQLEGLG